MKKTIIFGLLMIFFVVSVFAISKETFISLDIDSQNVSVGNKSLTIINGTAYYYEEIQNCIKYNVTTDSYPLYSIPNTISFKVINYKICKFLHNETFCLKPYKNTIKTQRDDIWLDCKGAAKKLQEEALMTISDAEAESDLQELLS